MSKYIQQDNKSHGAALLIFVVLFMISSTVVAVGIGQMVYTDLLQYRTLSESKESFSIAESSIEDIVYRFRTGKDVSSTETLTLGSASVSTSVTDNLGTFEVLAIAVAKNAVRKSYVELERGKRFSFEYGLQANAGGIIMENSSSVLGDVYSHGTLVGSGSNMIDGDAVSSGPSGDIRGVHVTGSAWAHNIQNSTIDGDIYYTTESGNTVGGIKYPGSPDMEDSTFLIDDAQIDEWEAAALAGGLIASTSAQCLSGTYTIDTDTTIGPVKIECNLYVNKSSTDLYLSGAVWVDGDIITKSGPSIHIVGSALGDSFPLIADNPENRTTSSKIILQNSANFYGAGDDSYVLLVSRNDDAQKGGPNVAIDSKNSASGDVLFYTLGGEVNLENSTSLREITAYSIRLQNNSEVIFEDGLTQMIVKASSTDPYSVYDWQEVE